MKTNKITRFILSGVLVAALTSCNDFLNVQPDNRTEMNTENKVVDLLTSAYATHQPWMFLELMSDNCDDHGSNYPADDRYAYELYHWEEPTQTSNDSPLSTWEDQYNSVAAANYALEFLTDLEETTTTRAARGEALLCRAYAHFILVNIFCQHYDPSHPEDLGIPYLLKPETELDPKHERGTVHEVYALIDKDLQEGLPLINDVIYSVPKYHFNRRAAYAFAARFYLYYQKYDEAIRCATEAISTNPESLLRDWADLAANYKANNGTTLVTAGTYYTSTALACNFLISTDYSNAGLRFGGYGHGYQYNHGQYIAQSEGVDYPTTPVVPQRNAYPYAASTSAKPSWRYTTLNFTSGLDKVLLPRVPYLFEYTDPVAGIGYRHAVYAIFTADETLLTRAEAYIMKQDYDAALADLQLYAKRACTSTRTMTTASITSWAESIEYYEPTAPTPKKRLNPAFTLDPTQEAFVHVLLSLRRHETLHCGLRWFDVKRFGIEIYRRTLANGNLAIRSVDDKLEPRDPRRAVQLPVEVLSAGLEPNPR